ACSQRKVQARLQGLNVEPKRKPGRRAAQVRLVGEESSRQAGEVAGIPSVDDIHILRGAGEPWAAAATPPTRMNSTPDDASVRSSSANLVTGPLRRGAKLFAELLELFEAAYPFLNREFEHLVNQRDIHIALVDLDDLVDRIHSRPLFIIRSVLSQ